MANLRILPNEVEAVACKRIEPEPTHWRIAVANVHRANIYRTRKPAKDERAFVAGGYVMAWDADRFQTYAD